MKEYDEKGMLITPVFEEAISKEVSRICLEREATVSELEDVLDRIKNSLKNQKVTLIQW